MLNQSVAETITGEERLCSDRVGMLFRSSVCQTLVTIDRKLFVTKLIAPLRGLCLPCSLVQ
jgi:hypothetical protein